MATLHPHLQQDLSRAMNKRTRNESLSTDEENLLIRWYETEFWLSALDAELVRNQRCLGFSVERASKIGIAESLLEDGASAGRRANSRETALELAINSDELDMLNLYVSYGALEDFCAGVYSLLGRAARRRSVECFAAILQLCDQVNDTTCARSDLPHIAAQAARTDTTDIIELLLGMGMGQLYPDIWQEAITVLASDGDIYAISRLLTAGITNDVFQEIELIFGIDDPIDVCRLFAVADEELWSDEDCERYNNEFTVLIESARKRKVDAILEGHENTIPDLVGVVLEYVVEEETYQRMICPVE